MDHPLVVDTTHRRDSDASPAASTFSQASDSGSTVPTTDVHMPLATDWTTGWPAVDDPEPDLQGWGMQSDDDPRWGPFRGFLDDSTAVAEAEDPEPDEQRDGETWSYYDPSWDPWADRNNAPSPVHPTLFERECLFSREYHLQLPGAASSPALPPTPTDRDIASAWRSWAPVEALQSGNPHAFAISVNAGTWGDFTDPCSAHDPYTSLALFALEQEWEPTRAGDEANLMAGDLTEQAHPVSTGNMSSTGRKQSRQSFLALPAAIFIHAGAGFHSIQNEKLHLSVCSDAASKAMKILISGGSAVDAVESAIKHLEDNEITNAGFGSNLTIDGTVECDATIVDHFGRSGACGAVPNIKNPISLAKVILETSSQTLSLRRVPPNFLVGEGAKRFGIDHGITMVANEDLVSRNAQDRYQKWRADLDKVGASSETGGASPLSTSGYRADTVEERRKGRDVSQEKTKLDLHLKARKGLQRDHASAIMTGLWNEGQPDSPTSETRSPLASFQNTTAPRSGRSHSSAPLSTASKRAKTSKPVRGSKTTSATVKNVGDVDTLDGACDFHVDLSREPMVAASSATDDEAVLEGARTFRFDLTELSAEQTAADRDMIVDTIGAIAIDLCGNISAGSSSGGIGMKHMGRTGPAALVGVGTAVIPSREGDNDFRTVATVTSGTGEHMATTMAAQKCADRLFQSTRRGPDGADEKEEDVAAILQSFVHTDFMGHPGVQNQASTSAIGVMAVEATANGIYVHWAHNTESFALASMSSADKQPLTVMSRLPESTASINIGGRKIQVAEPEDDLRW